MGSIRCRARQRRVTLFLIRTDQQGVVVLRMIRGRAPDPPEKFMLMAARGGKNGT